MHAYTRIRRYLYHKIKDTDITAKDVYDTLNCLFVKKNKLVGNAQLLQWMREDLNYNGEGFYDVPIESKYGKYLRFFYNLQRYSEHNELANLSLIPILKHGRRHIIFDTKALTDILKSIFQISRFGTWQNISWFNLNRWRGRFIFHGTHCPKTEQ